MPKQDYYEVLGVDSNATDRDIKQAFKRMARKYHPDVAENKEEAEIHFRQINEAYAILSDDEKKGMYDQFGHAAFGNSGGGGGGGGGSYNWPNSGGSGGFGFGASDLDDFVNAFFGSGRSGFGTGSSQRRTQAQRGRDLRKDVEIDLEQAYTGIETEFTVESYQPCPVCNGRRVKPGAGFRTCHVCHGNGAIRNMQSTFFGQFVTTTTCNKCHGEGQIPEELCEECKGEGRTINKEKITVTIPAGIENGTRMRVQERGEAGIYGGPSGDLYVFVFVREHDIFKRVGKDLFVDIPLGFADAALGAEKEIETFDGIEKVKIDTGIQSETVITLRGKGMPDIRGRRRGDLNVKVKVITPTKLTDGQRQILCDFAEEGPQFHYEEKGFFGKLFDALTGKGKKN
ncbi:MAG: molecular chaperone DnaJ [Candidatus Eremiobacteraeota bacterium]|nr:molecular chaperone DnaJ [Candidatus Eremiobacteraeota bacterium]